MKTLVKITLFAAFFFPTTAFCQPELEEAPLFGTTKSTDSKTHTIIIKNSGKDDLTITSVFFPKNVKVFLNKETIAPNETATLSVTFDQAAIQTDEYSATIKIISIQTKPGLKTTYESTYEIKGSFMY